MANCRLLRVDPTLQRWLWTRALQSVQVASCVAFKVQLLQWEKQVVFFFKPLFWLSAFFDGKMLDFVDGIDRLQELTLLGKFRISKLDEEKGVCTGGSGFSFVFKPGSINMNWLLTHVVLFASKSLRYLNLNKQISKEAMSCETVVQIVFKRSSKALVGKLSPIHWSCFDRP